MRTHAVTLLLAAGLPLTSSLFAQPQTIQPDVTGVAEGAATAANSSLEPANVAKPDFVQDKHAFGVLPNYRTAEGDQPYAPISTSRKFKIATDDTIDGPSFLLAGVFAGLGQWQNSNPSFGQGAKGYFHRYLTGLADQDVGNYLTEAIIPTLMHQDPRYYYQGKGTNKSRMLHAISSPFICRGDNGKFQPNFSSVGGDLSSSALSNLYYPPSNRGAGLVFQNFAVTTGERMLSALVQEFVLGRINATRIRT